MYMDCNEHTWTTVDGSQRYRLISGIYCAYLVVEPTTVTFNRHSFISAVQKESIRGIKPVSHSCKQSFISRPNE